ncbi:plasmid-related protein [Sulfurovum lithotrophicum]|uniref:plasmid-related protein n=1 Tax=Sulfurovum lithotrophicum TaxID=206403 RepID=UPI000A4F809E|nr:plasmid-related protein [Sulfurovum lithotrophicum]
MSIKKSETKNKISFNIRVEKKLKDAFVAACKENDDDASKVIRRMMRNYVQKNNPSWG